MSIFDRIAKDTRVYEPVRVSPKKDALTVMRNKFVANAVSSADLLEEGKEDGKFFSTNNQGEIVVSFRNGMRIIPIPPKGATHFITSKNNAISLLRDVGDAAERGEFDELLEQTRMKRRKKGV